MLGNWSFGDYYKKEAIEWAWELLTVVYQLLKKNSLLPCIILMRKATIYEKNNTDIDPSHIFYCGDKDNFWEMGDESCGPLHRNSL